jgi:lipopolysaccharide/colanic/teichoic acid biosynthesis glycosyltransferase/dTDP-glucose pyrophosphorylase
VLFEQTVGAVNGQRLAASSADVTPQRLTRAAKRAFDIVLAIVLLLLLAPVLLLVAIAIRIDSRGPSLYRCPRVGRGGREFSMLKFRKMVDGAAGPPLRAADDTRYTRLGRMLAISRLDEVPQLINVLKGDMSLVGPRPESPVFVHARRAEFGPVLVVRPGITGLSQLAFASEDSVLDPEDRERDYIRRILPAKLALDRVYIAHASVLADVRILFWTAAAVGLRMDVAVHRESGALGRRRRPAAERAPVHSHEPPAQPRYPHGVIKAATAGPRADDLRHTQVVILAGGRGTRLAPYTSILPKPLMPVGDRSILETVIEQLGEAGARRVTLSVGYLSHLIRAVFDHREDDGVEIVYVQERDALGTAAPLRLVGDLDDTFMVMNGDILTTLDYRELLRHHRTAGNTLTIATHDRHIKIDYGMLHLDRAGQVQLFEEKPQIVSPVSMGIYVVEPSALAYLPAEGRFDFPDLVQALLAAGEPVGAFRHQGLWFDIGRPTDYEAAVAAWNGAAA